MLLIFQNSLKEGTVDDELRQFNELFPHIDYQPEVRPQF